MTRSPGVGAPLSDLIVEALTQNSVEGILSRRRGLLEVIA